MKLQFKNTKKIILTLTFYFHKNLWIHLLLLFLVNSFILIGLTGILEAIQQPVFSSNINSFFGLALFLTVTEHIIKTFVSTQMYQLIMRSFGMVTSTIFIFMTMIYAMLIPYFQIMSVEGLIGIAFIFVFLRFYIRQFIVFRVSMKTLRGVKK
jgi:hypothetical protein